MIIDNTLAALRRTTSIITHDDVGLHGLRHVSDDAAVFGVYAFAFADIAQVTAGARLAVAGAYILVDPAEAAYVGETGNAGQRMRDHASDPGKAFATEVYVVSNGKRRLDKQECLHLQLRLSRLVESVGVVRLIKGTGPCTPELEAHRIATLDRMLEDAMPLLFDAGCRCLWPAPARPVRAKVVALEQQPEPQTDVDTDVHMEVDEADDDGSMEIGVSTVPIGVEEQELVHSKLWARGYMHEGGFVVAAGSEMRADANPSANGRTLERRNLLVKQGAVAPASADRFRLVQAVKFPTLGIAGKVLTGAHGGSERWRPLPPTQPFVIAP